MGKLTILAIDDDKDILGLLDLFLTKKGYTVVKAESGKRALEILKEMRPDLILLDIMMKQMSGYEVCMKIQESDNLSLIPVIFLTSLSSEKVKSKASSLGAADFLSKPIDKKRLYAVIKKHVSTQKKWLRFLHHNRQQREEKDQVKEIHLQKKSLVPYFCTSIIKNKKIMQPFSEGLQ